MCLFLLPAYLFPLSAGLAISPHFALPASASFLSPVLPSNFLRPPVVLSFSPCPPFLVGVCVRREPVSPLPPTIVFSTCALRGSERLVLGQQPVGDRSASPLPARSSAALVRHGVAVSRMVSSGLLGDPSGRFGAGALRARDSVAGCGGGGGGVRGSPSQYARLFPASQQKRGRPSLVITRGDNVPDPGPPGGFARLATAPPLTGPRPRILVQVGALLRRCGAANLGGRLGGGG